MRYKEQGVSRGLAPIRATRASLEQFHKARPRFVPIVERPLHRLAREIGGSQLHTTDSHVEVHHSILLANFAQPSRDCGAEYSTAAASRQGDLAVPADDPVWLQSLRCEIEGRAHPIPPDVEIQIHARRAYEAIAEAWSLVDVRL
jgi:hypothetical protein